MQTKPFGQGRNSLPFLILGYDMENSLYHSKATTKSENFQPFWWTGLLFLLSILVFVGGDLLPVSGWWLVLLVTGGSAVFEWNRIKRYTYVVKLSKGKKGLELSVQKEWEQFCCTGLLTTSIWWTYEFDPSGGKQDVRSNYIVLLRVEGQDGACIQFAESYSPWKSAPSGMDYSHHQLDEQLPTFEMDNLANFNAVIHQHQLLEPRPQKP